MRFPIVSRFLLAGFVLAALAVVAMRGMSYARQDRDSLLASSSGQHPAGTDALGRDRMVRVSIALLLSLAGAVIASALTTAAAAGVGALAAFGPTTVGWSVMLICDVFLALPWMFLLMIVRSALPLSVAPASSAAITFLVLATLGWPACARAVYKGALNLTGADWMLQARASGFREKSDRPHSGAQSSSGASAAVPHLDSSVRDCRGQSWRAWAGDRRAVAVVGWYAPRTR